MFRSGLLWTVKLGILLHRPSSLPCGRRSQYGDISCKWACTHKDELSYQRCQLRVDKLGLKLSRTCAMLNNEKSSSLYPHEFGSYDSCCSGERLKHWNNVSDLSFFSNEAVFKL